MIQVAAAKAASAAGWALFKRFWWIIPLVGAGIYILVLKGEVRHLDKKLERSQQLVGELTKSLEVTAASLDGALLQIKDNNRRILERNALLEAARRKAAADQARADARWDRTRRAVDALEASALDDTQDPCTVSPAAAAALEDL